MKNLYTLLAFILFTGLTVFSQGKVDYDSRSRFYLGFNFGGTYHSNTEVDVNQLYRGGAGFTFGYSFGMKPQRLLSLDLQLRYLLAAYRGLGNERYILDSNSVDVLNNGYVFDALNDYRDAYGYYVPGFKSWVNDWSLELKLNTNRLRERTGWNLFVLGGIGSTRYHTKADLLENSFQSGIKEEKDFYEKGLFNSDYETEIVNRRDWMPSFGMGIERQITPNAAFTLMGRMTWTRSNDFDGVANSSTGSGSLKNDRYHYASAGIKFYLRGHKNRYEEEDDDPIINPNRPVTGQKPTARFTTPNKTPINVSVDTYTLFAVVQNVAGKQNITYTHNGQIISSYAYNANTDKLSHTANLTQGQNTFTITAINNFGRAEDETIIIYNPGVTVQPPKVTITSPGTNNVTVNSSSYNLVSTVVNVDGKQDISVYVNGYNHPNFNYNQTNKVLTTQLNLVPGKNVVTVTGTNSVGSDSETVTIIYQEQVTSIPPVVKITNPSQNPYLTNQNSVKVVSTVQNVSAKQDITVKVNGVNTSNFNFQGTSVSLIVNLIQGNNIIQITGVNQYGQDQDQTTIIYQPVVTSQPPIVTISNPINGSSTTIATTQVQGQVLHVNSKQNITVRVNGQSINNFSFSNNTKLVKFNANLIPGNNTISIEGTNADGFDQASTNIVYNKPVVKTPPVVNIIDPVVDNKIYTVGHITAKSTVTNVNSANNIVVQLNGSNITNFSFNPSSNLVTIPLTLSSGNNVLIVSASNSDGSDSKQRIIKYKKVATINPPTVNYTNPTVSPITVSNASYNVTAATTNITGKNQIILKQNGNVINNNAYSFTAPNLSFSANLVQGNNVFEVIVTNSGGTDSKTTIIEYKKEACTAPTIGYVAPQPNSNVTTANHNIEAQINNHIPGTIVTLKLNGLNLGNMSYNSNTQIANKNVTLNQGVNTLEITVSNNCGTNKSTFILNYQFTAPCKVPVIKVTSKGSVVNTSTYNVKANITNITSANQVTFKLNGTTQNFNFSNGQLTSNLTLKPGVNTMVISVSNACGSDTKTIVVTYNPCQTPTVNITSSSNPITTTNYNLSAAITQISNSNQISLTVNGSGKNFNFSNGQLTSNLTLKPGVNTIVISVSNACGSDTKTIVVTYNPCQAPTVNITSSSNPITTTNYNLSAAITQISNSNQISLTVNGSGKNFNFSNGQLTSNLTLKPGVNTIVISVSNACGSDTKTIVVTYNPCQAPTVNITSSSSPITTTNYNLSAAITQISNSNQISLTVNGSGKNFNFSNGQLTSNLTLKPGVNTIVISVSNTCGNDTKTMAVTSNPCQGPVLKMLKPTTKSVTTTNNYYNLSLKVAGSVSQSNITVSQNGKVIPFVFNSSTKVLTINAKNLKNGVNKINVTVTNKCGNAVLDYQINAKLCVTPTVNIVTLSGTKITTVTSLSYAFKATVKGMSSKNGIKLTLNGTPVSFSFNAGTGLVTASLKLKEGINNIVLSANNACGKDSKSLTLQAKTCNAPKITNLNLSTPKYTQASSQSFVFGVSGVSNSNQIVVKLNGKVINKSFVSNKLKFTASGLKIGLNTITVEVTNNCGKDKETITITRKACNKPVINQQSNSTTASSLTFPYSAVISGVTSKQNIVLKVNNKSVSFTFNTKSGLLKSNLLLKEGNNSIVLKATNNCGSSTKSHAVKATTCKKPEIKLGYPTNTSITTANSVFSILAVGINVVQNDISVTNNGKKIPFTFDASKGKITVQVSNMSAGANNIKIKGSNACGSSEVNYVITYTGTSNSNRQKGGGFNSKEEGSKQEKN